MSPVVRHHLPVTSALLFDLDRTLVDVQSFTDYAAARADAEAVVGHDRALTAVPTTDWSSDTEAAMALLVTYAGDPRWEALSAAIAVHELAAVVHSTPMPTLAAAWQLSASVPRAVVTLVPEHVARAALSAHGIDASADALVVVGRRAGQRPKPAPDGLHAACDALGVDPSSAVMIGDSSWDLAAARAAGTGFVGVPFHPGGLPDGTPTAADLEAAVRRTLG